jgi:hypothetical protein
LISTAEQRFERAATKQVESLIRSIRQADQEVVGAALVSGSSRVLPAIDAILKSHALIHTAEGELFRRVLENACEGCALRSARVPSKGIFAHAAIAPGTSESGVRARIAKLGKASGPPWAIDQKEAAMAAIVCLRSAKMLDAKAQRRGTQQA